VRAFSLVVALAAILGLSNEVRSQIPDPARRQSGAVVPRPGTQAGRGGQGARGAIKQQRQQEKALAGANRPALERQVRQAVARVVRQRLNLNDQQMQSLTRVDNKFDAQRRNLLRDERTARQNLKAAMADTAAPDQNRISQYLDQLTQAQHQRADLLASEQKELSTFLTPMQRAQYLSIKERVTARMLQLQQTTGGGRGVPPEEP
jgi:alanyl-tRNA synthetase